MLEIKIVFLSNFLLHHQTDFCEEMYRLSNGNFRFIATGAITEERKKLGYKDYSNDNLAYYLDSNEKNKMAVDNAIQSADVVIIGSAPFYYLNEPIKNNKLIYIYSERICKTLITTLKSILKGTVYKRYFKLGRKDNVRLLSASAYLPNEMSLIHSFKDRMIKWGYYPTFINKEYDYYKKCKEHDRIHILWVGRMIPYKRPMYPVYLAEYLKKHKIDAEIFLIGTGCKESKIKSSIKNRKLDDMITVLGSMSPEKVREYMDSANIFIFTSNAEEGWGAVLNEAMNSACAIVASNKIGAVPYLLKHYYNGLIFKDGNLKCFLKLVTLLCEDKKLCETLGENALGTILNLWNSKVSTQRLYKILESDFYDKKLYFYDDGPCSKAYKTKNYKKIIKEK